MTETQINIALGILVIALIISIYIRVTIKASELD
jgi:hypothetical protein